MISFDETEIRIVKGPPPVFSRTPVANLSPNDSQIPVLIFQTTVQGDVQGLLPRCKKAWKGQQNIYFYYRDFQGGERKALIVSARAAGKKSNLLILGVAFNRNEIQDPMSGKPPPHGRIPTS